MLNFSTSLKLKAHKLSESAKYSSSQAIRSSFSLNKCVICAFPHLKAIKFSVMYIIVECRSETFRGKDENFMIQIFCEKMWVFFFFEELGKTAARYKMHAHLPSQENNRAVLKMPIMVFVLATERSLSGFVTPSFAKLWE